MASAARRGRPRPRAGTRVTPSSRCRSGCGGAASPPRARPPLVGSRPDATLLSATGLPDCTGASPGLSTPGAALPEAPAARRPPRPVSGDAVCGSTPISCRARRLWDRAGGRRSPFGAPPPPTGAPPPAGARSPPGAPPFCRGTAAAAAGVPVPPAGSPCGIRLTMLSSPRHPHSEKKVYQASDRASTQRTLPAPGHGSAITRLGGGGYAGIRLPWDGPNAGRPSFRPTSVNGTRSPLRRGRPWWQPTSVGHTPRGPSSFAQKPCIRAREAPDQPGRGGHGTPTPRGEARPAAKRQGAIPRSGPRVVRWAASDDARRVGTNTAPERPPGTATWAERARTSLRPPVPSSEGVPRGADGGTGGDDRAVPRVAVAGGMPAGHGHATMPDGARARKPPRRPAVRPNGRPRRGARAPRPGSRAATASHPFHRRTARVTLWPPKPKELERATSNSAARGRFGTQSRSHAGSGCS